MRPTERKGGKKEGGGIEFFHQSLFEEFGGKKKGNEDAWFFSPSLEEIWGGGKKHTPRKLHSFFCNGG